jgi:hypothetical protein
MKLKSKIVKIDGDDTEIIFFEFESTGRIVDAKDYNQCISLRKDYSGNTIMQGYDLEMEIGNIPDVPEFKFNPRKSLIKEEKLEICDYVIKKWQEYKKSLQI